jgi:hypothetical protein
MEEFMLSLGLLQVEVNQLEDSAKAQDRIAIERQDSGAGASAPVLLCII